MKPPFALNMIVKNEAPRIERCLRSVLPYVKFAAIYDTGSTDDTKEIIKRVCLEHGVMAFIEDGKFNDFSQARNAAFRWARMLNVGKVQCQFALLVDADMEFVVDRFDDLTNLNANALSYDMMQTGGAVSYANRRLLNLSWGSDPYVGVTHEYVDVQTAGMIKGAHFIDHADGSSRADKYPRDAALLEAALKDDPKNGRTLYYLGNTYRDWERPIEAISYYRQRIELGGWDEETHDAMMNSARCWKDRGDNDKYVAGMVEAFNFRPRRAEPLHDLANFYREAGKNEAALIFAQAGLKIPRPDDLLFVNDFVYSHGLRYEFSIVGAYSEAERNRAFEVTDDLALDPTCPPDHRYSARSNLYWHTKPLSHYCPSFVDEKLDFQPPEGYTATNPSIEICNGLIKCNIRCVNYTIDSNGAYIINTGGEAIDTRNFLCNLTSDLDVDKVREIIWDRPLPNFNLVTGLEDIRLWRYCGELHFSATVREQSMSGQCQLAAGRLTYDSHDQTMHVDNYRIISDGDEHQKNWMPMPSAPYGHPRWMYRLDTVIEPMADKRVATIHPSKLYVKEISGSSQLIPFRHGYLAVVHEASNGPDNKRTYWHRFAWLQLDGELRRLSLPFVFLDKQIEFCAGLALHPDGVSLLISYGVRDCEAHVAKVSIEEVGRMIWKYHEN